MEIERVTADVLCIGGGIAGLMAAISAGELGVKVVVIEKGNAQFSGAGRSGDDHFEVYVPEVHGPDIEAFLPSVHVRTTGRQVETDLLRIQFARSLDIVQKWEQWGIPMKYHGKWEFAGHCLPGRQFTHIKYAGQMQKKVLLKQAVERGVLVINRVMGFELLQDKQGIIGAIGVHTREDKIILLSAKSIILGTGLCDRLYPSITPGWMFNVTHGGAVTGDGRAMAYRAGAELINVEMLARTSGPRYYAKQGQGSWVGIYKDGQGKRVSPYLKKANRKYNDVSFEINRLMPEEYARTGKGPIYMDCRGISDDDYNYMLYWLQHEGNLSLLNYIKEEGIDVRNNLIEFGTYHMKMGGGIAINPKTEATLRGLYAAGSELSFGSLSAAATFGWIAGENAAGHARKTKLGDIQNAKTTIDTAVNLIRDLRSRDEGPGWKEVNIALQQTMNDYCGPVRYGNLLSQGLTHLQRIKQKAYQTMVARNSHELNRCLEVLNLLQLGELAFIAASCRKETRGSHRRTDYPFINPVLDNKYHTIKQIKGKAVNGWKGARY